MTNVSVKETVLPAHPEVPAGRLREGDFFVTANCEGIYMVLRGERDTTALGRIEAFRFAKPSTILYFQADAPVEPVRNVNIEWSR